MRLKSHHATGHPTVTGLRVQKRQHGLMTPMNTIEVTNGQSARLGQIGVVKSFEYSHIASLGA
jgi:hypothetical protein